MESFWNFETDGNQTVLRLEGTISSETWWGDEVTPAAFRAELEKHPGDIAVWINSPGGDVIAGSQIYTALKEHKGLVTVKIDGIAASAASVVAMAGDVVLMSPTAYLMVHDPWSMACGNSRELRHGADVLDEIRDGIVQAYVQRTELPESRVKQLMADETWMNAVTAMELGFADGMLFADSQEAQALNAMPKSMPAHRHFAAEHTHPLHEHPPLHDGRLISSKPPQRGMLYAQAKMPDKLWQLMAPRSAEATTAAEAASFAAGTAIHALAAAYPGACEGMDAGHPLGEPKGEPGPAYPAYASDPMRNEQHRKFALRMKLMNHPISG